MVVYYDPHVAAINSIFVVNGSVLAAVLLRLEFWVISIGHVIPAVYYYVDETAYIAPLPEDGWWLLSSLIAFFAVFYSSQCYRRYQEIYICCQDIDMQLKLFTQNIVIYLHQPSIRVYVKCAAKYMIAAVFNFYFKLTDGGDILEEEWELFDEKGLLTEQELDYIRNKFQGHKNLLLSSWAVRNCQTALGTQELQNIYSAPERAALMTRLDHASVEFCKKMRRVADLLALPVPFAYFHTFSLILILNFAVTSWYLVAKYKTPLTIVPFFAYVLCFLGIRQLAASLADPFLPEHYDCLRCAFPVLAFLNTSYLDVCALMETIEAGHIKPETRCDSAEAKDHLQTHHANHHERQLTDNSLEFGHHRSSHVQPMLSDCIDHTTTTLSDMAKERPLIERLFVGQQTHMIWQWNSNHISQHVRPWVRQMRREAFHATLVESAQKEQACASAPAESKSALDPKEALAPKPVDAPPTTNDQHIMEALNELANNQRALYEAYQKLVSEKFEGDLPLSDEASNTQAIDSPDEDAVTTPFVQTVGKPQMAKAGLKFAGKKKAAAK